MYRCAKSCAATAVFTLLMALGVFGDEASISVVPIGTGPNGELAPGAVIDGDTITIITDPVDPIPVFFEFRIGDWDPNDIGTRLAGYTAAFDSLSYASGTAGVLTPNVGSDPCGACSDNASPCFSVVDCSPGTCSVSGNSCHPVGGACPAGEVCVGAASCNPVGNGDDVCEAQLGTGSWCAPPGYYLGTGTCSFAYTDSSRADFVLADAGATIPALGVNVPDFRTAFIAFSGAPHDPVPFPAEGFYAATFSLLVPPDARGTFTISLKPFPDSILDSAAGPPITPFNVFPARIRVNPGRCCYQLQLTPQDRQRCVDNVTESECAERLGVTFFETGATCADPCPAVCGDNVNNQASEACDGTDDASCPGACSSDCVCVSCGDDVVNLPGEVCDGTDDAACPGLCLGDCTCPAFCGDDVVNQPGEVCDGTDDAACPGLCQGDCTCPATCGDNIVNQEVEECDGSDDAACPGLCLGDCTCDAFCGDDEINLPGEECDGADDAACPDLCLGDCTCAPFCGDNIVNQDEECDGTDNAACAGICLSNCRCNPTCGDINGDGDADMLGVAIFMNCFTGSGGGPVAPECTCAKFDADDDIDLDDFLGFFNALNGP